MKNIEFKKVFYQRNIDLGIDPECHECTSHCLNGGYPQVKREGRMIKLHRYMYIQSTGESPPVVMHLCDNRKCINLLHLKGGTVSDNNQDKSSKGRVVSRLSENSGERHYKSRLTEESVRWIKVWIVEGFSDTIISKAFNVSRGCIKSIRREDSWKEVII